MFVICIHHASDFCSRKLLTFGHHSPSSRFASSIGIGSLGLHNPRSHQQQPLNLVQDGQDGLNKAKSLGGPYEFFPMILISYPHISFSWVINMHPKKVIFPKSSVDLQVRGLLRAQPPTKRGEQRWSHWICRFLCGRPGAQWHWRPGLVSGLHPVEGVGEPLRSIWLDLIWKYMKQGAMWSDSYSCYSWFMLSTIQQCFMLYPMALFYIVLNIYAVSIVFCCWLALCHIILVSCLLAFGCIWHHVVDYPTMIFVLIIERCLWPWLWMVTKSFCPTSITHLSSQAGSP